MKRFLLILLVPILLFLVWWFLRGSAPPQVAFTTVHRETVVSTLTTNGKAEPSEWVAVRSEVAGSVDRIHVQRGQTVSQGQLLVSLNVSQAQADLASAQSRIAQTRAELETLTQGGRASDRAEVESGLARAREELASARRDYDALKRLVDRNAATKAELQAAQDLVTRAELQIQSLERRRSSLVTQPDRTSAQAKLQEAQALADAATQRIAQSQIRSQMTGVLYAFDLKPGAFLNPGDEVARVGQLRQLRVIVYVDEPELGRVSKGMPVTITWDALPGREWKGTVERVPLQVVPLGTRQVGEVICTIDNPDLSLIPGTNVNAEIRSSVVENALTVPKEAIRRQGSDSGVFKLEGERVIWQPVKLGVSSVTRMQVVSGVSDGDRVALQPDVRLASGQAVRPVLSQ